MAVLQSDLDLRFFAHVHQRNGNEQTVVVDNVVFSFLEDLLNGIYVLSRILDARQHENLAARIFYFLHIGEICRPGSLRRSAHPFSLCHDPVSGNN